MLRQCACCGSNENCQRCYGSGYVEGPDSLPISKQVLNWAPAAFKRQKGKKHKIIATSVAPNTTSHARTVTPAEQKLLTRFVCRYCFRGLGSVALLYEHEMAEHVADDTDHSPEAFIKPLVRRRGAIFVRSKLPRTDPHYRPDANITNSKLIKAEHPKIVSQHTDNEAARSTQSPKLSSPQIATQKVQTGRTLMRCPKCHSNVRSDRLDAHLRKMHGRSKQKPQLQRARNQNADTTHRTILQHNRKLFHFGNATPTEMDEYKANRRLDGSQDFWQYREEGRFGSHPEFDSFDDESAP